MYKDSKTKIKKILIATLKNKWFWIIVVPIIFLIVFYIYMLTSYDKTVADLTTMIVATIVVVIMLLILFPPKRRYDPIRDAIYEEEMIREKARQDVSRGRRYR